MTIGQHDHNSESKAQAVNSTRVKIGVYQVDLRIPPEGLFAGEELDIEFRVSDTTLRDPYENGYKGVGGIESTADLTMPAMAGMPVAKPKTHREGIPGEYGVVAFFPHGGEYKIDLTLKFPDTNVRTVSFRVNVNDERKTNTVKAQPYSLKVIDWPQSATSGKPLRLKLRVVDNKTNTTVTQFDESHTKYFHLLLASKDLNWFRHEHPVMAPDGTWTLTTTFPAGGKYWIYGDSAPAGQGSRILIASAKVSGPSPTWDTRLKPTPTATSGHLKGILTSLQPIKVGRATTLQVKLFDARSGAPATDTIPWLGAAGHMMIFHQDGQTVVHSHPSEDKEGEMLVKSGIVRFSGRFPKAGLYKVYAQFDWQGAVRTLGFALRVK